MLIDWFTVGAQVVNFIILVWLMKRFLFKPILTAIDAREKRISTELKDAKSKQNEAKKERDEFQSKNEDFDKQRNDLLEKAKKDADKERDQLIAEARKAADELSARRQDLLKKEAHELNEELGRKVRDEVFTMTRKVLSDLADADLEGKICTLFIQRLSDLDANAKKHLGEALKSASDPAIIQSTFEISKDERAEIVKALKSTFDVTIQLTFETKPELVSGIELIANGQKIAWSIDDYLTAMKKNILESLSEEEAPKAKPKAKPSAKPTAPTGAAK
jgi:F-type H+-transporting ATPase subunit b